jgi:hypothetical protein
MDNGFPMTMDNALAVALACLFQHKQVQRFAPLDEHVKISRMVLFQLWK